MRHLTENYLAIAVVAAFAGSAAWVLYVLYGAGLQGEERAVVLALGLAVSFVAPFTLVIFLSGLAAAREDISGDGSLRINLLSVPHQRERLGLVLMAAGLVGLVSLAVAEDATPIVAVGSVILVVGGGGLVVSALQVSP